MDKNSWLHSCDSHVQKASGQTLKTLGGLWEVWTSFLCMSVWFNGFSSLRRWDPAELGSPAPRRVNEMTWNHKNSPRPSSFSSSSWDRARLFHPGKKQGQKYSRKSHGKRSDTGTTPHLGRDGEEQPSISLTPGRWRWAEGGSDSDLSLPLAFRGETSGLGSGCARILTSDHLIISSRWSCRRYTSVSRPKLIWDLIISNETGQLEAFDTAAKGLNVGAAAGLHVWTKCKVWGRSLIRPLDKHDESAAVQRLWTVNVYGHYVSKMGGLSSTAPGQPSRGRAVWNFKGFFYFSHDIFRI